MSRAGSVRSHLPPQSGGPGAPNPLSYFSKVKKLGEGGFGKVFLVRDSRDQQLWVMKEVGKNTMQMRFSRMMHRRAALHCTAARENNSFESAFSFALRFVQARCSRARRGDERVRFPGAHGASEHHHL